MLDINGSSALNKSSPASAANLLTSLPLVSDTHGRIAAQPQVVEREGGVGFEWLISWKPPRLSLQRVQRVCFSALVDTGLRDATSQPVASMSLPHCVTFVVVPDPPPSWSPTTLAIAPLRIVMGTLVTLQLQAADDNPDDSIRLESLTPPANLPSFARFTAGASNGMLYKAIIAKHRHNPSQAKAPSRQLLRQSSATDPPPCRRGDQDQPFPRASLSLRSSGMAAKTSRFVSKPWILRVKRQQGPCRTSKRRWAQGYAFRSWLSAAFTGECF